VLSRGLEPRWAGSTTRNLTNWSRFSKEKDSNKAGGIKAKQRKMFLLTMEGCDEEMLSKKVASAPSPTATTAIGDPTLPALAMAHGAPAHEGVVGRVWFPILGPTRPSWCSLSMFGSLHQSFGQVAPVQKAPLGLALPVRKFSLFLLSLAVAMCGWAQGRVRGSLNHPWRAHMGRLGSPPLVLRHQLAHKWTLLLPSSSLLAICSLGSQVKEPLFSSPCLQLQSRVC
jgi:hypothetical protein